jgi:hypothetical protein
VSSAIGARLLAHRDVVAARPRANATSHRTPPGEMTAVYLNRPPAARVSGRRGTAGRILRAAGAAGTAPHSGQRAGVARRS